MDQEIQPKNLLIAGVEILDVVLRPHGFVFTLEHHAKGSGGWFASGSYTRDDRRLELHFRQTLGMVRYHIRADSLGHEAFMKLLGVYGRNLYPDFPLQPLDSFRCLASDLRNYCADFVSGDGLQFITLARRAKQSPQILKGVP